MRSNLKAELFSILKDSGSENPTLESELLYRHLFSSDKAGISAPENHLEKHLKLIKKSIPVQRQLGYTEVKGLPFRITKDVLLPGIEIEVLLKACFNNLARPKNIADICTGSGVIAVALGKKFKTAKIFATDISEKALNIAKLNSYLHKTRNITFLKGDLFQPLYRLKIHAFDLIVSNPPYCKTTDINKLPPQIKLHTPKIAIDGGVDGLRFHRLIIDNARKFLKKGGFLVLENEAGQSKILKQMLIERGYKVVSIHKNSKDEERVIVAKKE